MAFQRREACRAVSSPARGPSGGAPGGRGLPGRSGRAPHSGDLGEVGLAEQFVELGLHAFGNGLAGQAERAGAEAALLEDVLHDLPQLAGFLGEAEQGEDLAVPRAGFLKLALIDDEVVEAGGLGRGDVGEDADHAFAPMTKLS